MRYFFVVLLVHLQWSAVAQYSELSGTVKNNETPIPVAAVQVQSDELLKGDITDEQGRFYFKDLPAGDYEMQIRCLGYKPHSRKITLPRDAQLTFEIELEQDLLHLDQFVVTATRSQVPLYEAPIIVNSISPKTFEATQSLSLAEGLSFSPGLRVENNCQNCGFTQLRMNGLDGPYSQILINSRPIFSSLIGIYGLEMIPANMIDRVEVVKGGGSVMYGGNAIAGTVNIITKDPVLNSFEVGFNQGYINGETPDRTVSLNGTVVSKDLNKGIALFAFNRHRDPWDANGDGYSEITKLENTTIGFDAFFNVNDRNKFKINAFKINDFRRGGNKFDLAPHQTDITEQVRHDVNSLGISFEHVSKDGKHRLALYTSGQTTQRDSYYGGGGRVLTPQDSLNEDDIAALNAYGNTEDVAVVGGVQYSIELSKMIVLSAGGEYQYNSVNDQMPGYERAVNQEVGTIGTYAQLELKPTAKLSLLVGGRFDHVNINGEYSLEQERFENKKDLNVFVPRLSLMYDLTKSVKLRGSYAQGYRAPQAFDEDLHIEMVGGAARFIVLDPNLETERSNNFTASLNYSNRVKSVQTNLVFEGFYTQLINPFILSDATELPSGISVITKRNGTGASVQGLNMEANLGFSSDFIVQVGWTLQTAIYDEEEVIWSPEENSELPATSTSNILRTPKSYGFFTLKYLPIKRLETSLSGVYTGTMEVPHVIDPGTEQTIIKSTPDLYELNFKLAYTINLQDDFNIEFYAGIQNMLNSFQDDFDSGPDRDAGYVYGPTRPRTFFAGLKMGLNN
jgi:outer membrane receptor for ferrienterochelin and colicins